MKTRSLLLAMLTFSTFSSHARADHEIGFVEKFALAADRSVVLQELIAGTEDYYFYHALHYQNTGKQAELKALLEQWSVRNEHSPLLKEIQHRQALLSYDTDPRATLKYLRDVLHVEFNHVQQTLNPKPDLPTALDPQAITAERFIQQALRDSIQISGLTPEGVEFLLAQQAKLTPAQRHQLLGQVTRPDAPGLVPLILADLGMKESRGFGELPIHGNLLLPQLEQLAKAKPDLRTNANFIQVWLGKLRPNADVNLETNATAREAWLEAAWQFVKDLVPGFNSLKAQVLYARLQHDLALGKADPTRFLTYLKLPRNQGYVNPKYRENAELFRHQVDLNQDFNSVLGCLPIHDDEPLVRSYLLQFLTKSADPAVYAPVVAENYLQALLAEAQLISGQGNAEKWFSLLQPSAVQALRSRVDLDFATTNPEHFAPDQEVSLEVFVKNVAHLTASIFEINTLNYYRSTNAQISTDLNLDGLIANVQQTADYLEPPIQRLNRKFTFLKNHTTRGVWMVDFIGNGKSSRALIRKGELHYVTRPSSAGTALIILDETLQPMPKATALVAGQEFKADAHGEIILPFSNQPGSQSVILTDGAGFAQLEQITLAGENYKLTAGFHVPHESLLSGRQATLAIRPTLTINDAPTDVKYLEEVKLTIVSTTQDGIHATITPAEFKLTADREATFSFTVPERLAQLDYTLEAKVKSLLTGEKINLSATGSQTINGLDKSEQVGDLYFSRMGTSYFVQCLGRTGEPRAEQPCTVNFRRREFTEHVSLSLKTDGNGSISLGGLAGIATVEVITANGATRYWALPQDQFSTPENLHIAVGDTLALPWLEGAAKPDASLVSLLEQRRGTFVRDALTDKTVSVKQDYLLLQNLDPGDYSLRYGSPAKAVTIRVTQGKPAEKFLLGEARTLERSGYRGLQINGVSKDAEFLTIQLGSHDPDARVHILASRFIPDFDAFSTLGQAPGLEPMVGTPASLKSLFLSGRTLGEEYRYVLDRRTAPKFPGSLLPRPGLLLNPWAVQDTSTVTDDAKLGDEFKKLAPGGAAVGSRAQRRAAKEESVEELKRSPSPHTGPSSMNFLAHVGVTLWNLVPDEKGLVKVKLADLKDRQFLRILAVDRDSSVLRDISLADAKTQLRDLTLRNGLDPQGHFTRQNEVTVLEKDAPYLIKDAATAQYEISSDLGKIFNLFRTLSKNATLDEFAFVLDWPTLDAAKKSALFSEHACHELSFFLAQKDPAFFKAVVQPYYGNKRHQTFLDHYLLGKELTQYLPAWNYGRLNVVERILLAQRLPAQATVTAREIRDQWHMLPVNVVQVGVYFDTVLGNSSLSSDLGAMREELELKAQLASSSAAPANLPAAAPMPALDAADHFGDPLSAGKKAKEGGLGFGRVSGTERGADGNRAFKSSLNEFVELRLADKDKALSAYAFIEQDRDDKRGELHRFGLQAQAFYRKQLPTKEWAENNYYNLRISEQLASLVTANAFWADYAAWDGKGGFLSPNVSAAAGNFTEMMLALSVLDLPFPKDAAEPKSELKDLSLTLTPTHRALLFHREIKPAEIDKEAPKLLVSQNFYRNGDRYTQLGNEKVDRFVSEEFLTGVVYGCQVVVTNPTSSVQKLDVLVQIPQGAISVLGSKPTDNVPLALEAYRTHTQDYYFYFPKAGEYPQHPVHVSKSEKVVAYAEPFTFTVVDELTKLDKASWDYVSQFGNTEDVLEFLDQANLHLLEMDKIAWRCQEKGFFTKALTLLNARHVYAPTLWSYSLKHHDAVALGQWLQHQDGWLAEMVPSFHSKWLTLDPVERYDYEQLEYSPLVNARAHLLGTERMLLNDHFLGQYQHFLTLLAHQPQLDDEAKLSVVYYLLLQDRVEEALTWWAKVDGSKVAEQLQVAYLQCVLAFYQADTATARKLATAHANESVPRWKDKFVEVLAQLDEIDGKKPEGAKEEDREARQNQLAAVEPTLDFTVENKEIRLKYHNVKEVTVNYYPMDLEFLFSTAPFVSSDTSRFRMITPGKTERVVLAADKDAHTLALPKEFTSSNVLVEITAAGKSSAHAYYANELNISVSESQGRLQVLHAGDNRPLPKTYVKVFAEINGQPKFYKDGYTDLRGKFDYLSLSTAELDKATKFGILILSEEHGAAVKEVKPPQQ